LIKVKNQVNEGSKIVCILTGNGLKDPDNAIKYSNADVKKTSSELNDILKVMNI
jgi:threonine synthase